MRGTIHEALRRFGVLAWCTPVDASPTFWGTSACTFWASLQPPPTRINHRPSMEDAGRIGCAGAPLRSLRLHRKQRFDPPKTTPIQAATTTRWQAAVPGHQSAAPEAAGSPLAVRLLTGRRPPNERSEVTPRLMHKNTSMSARF